MLLTKISGRGRAKKSATPAVNGTAAAPAKNAKGKSGASPHQPPAADMSLAAGNARAKKAATPVSAPTKAAAKRKLEEEIEEEEDDEAESEPEAKPAAKKLKKDPKAKPVKAPAVPKSALPKGPRRVRGNKTEVNALRYTQPLKVFVFGEGSSGELGLGATKKAIDVKRPRFNEALSKMNVVKVATGGMHVVALTQDNKILTWGVNDNGALGRDTSAVEAKMRDMDEDDSDSEDESGGLNELEATPTAIPDEHFPENTTFVDVVAGDSCSFALTTEGAVYGWGTFRVSVLTALCSSC
jgi:regulator of chromosome condensation